MVFGYFALLITYIIGIIRASLPYMFIYFLLCLYNLQYTGYKHLKFFGIELDTYEKKIKANKLFIFFINNYYVIIIIFNILFISVLIHYSLLNNIISILFIIVFYLLIWINIKFTQYIKKDENWKNKYFNFFFNVSLVAILGCYVNILYEILAPLLIFKVNYFDTVLKLIEDRQILKFSQNNKNWFSLFIKNKEFLSKHSLFLLKNKIVDKTYFYNFKEIITKSKKFNKEFNGYFINMVNAKDVFASRNVIYEKIKMNELNNNNNYININNYHIKSLDILIDNINHTDNNNKFNNNNIKHNLDAYFNWKLITLNQTGLTNQDFWPTQEIPAKLIELLKTEKLGFDVSALLLSDEDLVLSNNYMDACQNVIDNTNLNFDILLKKKVTIYECLKFNYFNENFKRALQVNISYTESKALENKNNLFSLYNINVNDLEIRLHSNLSSVIKDIFNIKYFFYELYNYNSELNPSINFSLFKYNKFLLLWENSKYVQEKLNVNNKFHELYNFDEEVFTESTESLLEKNNSNYINFKINDGEITVTFDLSELYDYKDLFLSFNLNKSLLFYQYMYPIELDLPRFYTLNVKDIFTNNVITELIESIGSRTPEELKELEELEEEEEEELDEYGNPIEKKPEDLKEPEESKDPKELENKKISEETPKPEEFSLDLQYDFYAYTNEDGTQTFYQFDLKNLEMKEISSTTYYESLNLIKNYNKTLNYTNYYKDLSYYYSTILKDLNFKKTYSACINKKTLNSFNDFIVSFEEQRQKELQQYIEFKELNKSQKFLHFHIKNEKMLKFLKENPNIENFYILLLQYNIVPFKEWLNLINEFKDFNFNLCVEGKHTFLNRDYYLSILNKVINDNIDKEYYNPISIHFQMEEIKRIKHFYEIVYFTFQDMSTTDTEYTIEKMKVKAEAYKQIPYDYKLNLYIQNILDYLKNDYDLSLLKSDVDIEEKHEALKKLYKKDFLSYKKMVYWNMNYYKCDRDEDPEFYDTMRAFTPKVAEKHLASIRNVHKENVDSLYYYGLKKAEIIKRGYFEDLKAFEVEIENLRAIDKVFIDSEVQLEIAKFQEWVKARQQLEISSKLKKTNSLTNYFLNKDWDNYNKQRALNEIFKFKDWKINK